MHTSSEIPFFKFTSQSSLLKYLRNRFPLHSGGKDTTDQKANLYVQVIAQMIVDKYYDPVTKLKTKVLLKPEILALPGGVDRKINNIDVKYCMLSLFLESPNKQLSTHCFVIVHHFLQSVGTNNLKLVDWNGDDIKLYDTILSYCIIVDWYPRQISQTLEPSIVEFLQRKTALPNKKKKGDVIDQFTMHYNSHRGVEFISHYNVIEKVILNALLNTARSIVNKNPLDPSIIQSKLSSTIDYNVLHSRKEHQSTYDEENSEIQSYNDKEDGTKTFATTTSMAHMAAEQSRTPQIGRVTQKFTTRATYPLLPTYNITPELNLQYDSHSPKRRKILDYGLTYSQPSSTSLNLPVIHNERDSDIPSSTYVSSQSSTNFETQASTLSSFPPSTYTAHTTPQYNQQFTDTNALATRAQEYNYSTYSTQQYGQQGQAVAHSPQNPNQFNANDNQNNFNQLNFANQQYEKTFTQSDTELNSAVQQHLSQISYPQQFVGEISNPKIWYCEKCHKYHLEENPNVDLERY